MSAVFRLIRVGVFTLDARLQPLLAPGLGSNFQVVSESDVDRLKELLLANAFDVLLLDMDATYSSPEQQMALFDDVSASPVAVVVMADDEARLAAMELVQRGAHSYCRKPPALRELKAIIHRAYEYISMKRELAGRSGRDLAPQCPVREVASCDRLIGGSAEMKVVYDLIRRVTNLNASVLVNGESGTGKELIARAIHNLGDRAKAPFVAVACGAIPETLIESELFGHEKGAFTGSTGSRAGYFEQAANGTLFLDEIGELSLQTQVKLLRVLQNREFMRLGSGRVIPLRARIVFATHRDLQSMVTAGTFRLDLFYRLSVVTITAPSLADHPEDIPFLADHFVRQYSEMYARPVNSISPSAMGLLQSYDWPGNVRELENVIQSAIISTDSEAIQPEALPARFREMQLLPESETSPTGSFEMLIRDFKCKIALKAIEDCQGNKTLAAQSLSISRAYLHRLIRQTPGVEAIDAA